MSLPSSPYSCIPLERMQACPFLSCDNSPLVRFKGVCTGSLRKICRTLLAASQIIELSGKLERKGLTPCEHSVVARVTGSNGYDVSKLIATEGVGKNIYSRNLSRPTAIALFIFFDSVNLS